MAIPRRRGGRAAMAIVLAAAVTAVVVAGSVASADTGAACAAVYSISWQTPSDSPPDFGATVTVTNNAAYAISTWSVTWTIHGRAGDHRRVAVQRGRDAERHRGHRHSRAAATTRPWHREPAPPGASTARTTARPTRSRSSPARGRARVRPAPRCPARWIRSASTPPRGTPTSPTRRVAGELSAAEPRPDPLPRRLVGRPVHVADQLGQRRRPAGQLRAVLQPGRRDHGRAEVRHHQLRLRHPAKRRGLGAAIGHHGRPGRRRSGRSAMSCTGRGRPTTTPARTPRRRTRATRCRTCRR